MNLSQLPVNKNTALILGAIALAAVSVVLVKQYLDKEKQQYQSELSAALSRGMIQVVVPNRDVPAGTVVGGANMSQRLYPQDLVYEDAITVEKWPEYAGRLVVKPIRAGKPLLTSDFVASGGAGFAGTLPADTRAVTIAVDSINSINGLLQPGDYVDVLLSQRDNQAGVGTQVLPVLRRTQVLATGRQLATEDDGGAQRPMRSGPVGLLGGPAQIPDSARNYNTITVAVSPVEAASLVLAQQVGQLRVMLASANRSEDDEPVVPGMTQAELIARLGGVTERPRAAVAAVAPRAPSPVATPVPVRMVEFIIGSTGGVEKTSEAAPGETAAMTPDRPEAVLQALAAAAALEMSSRASGGR